MELDALGLAARIAEIDTAKAALKADIKELDSERRGLEEALMDAFTAACVQNLSVGGRIVYLHQQRWVRVLDNERAIAQVTGDLNVPEVLMVGVQRLSSMAREDSDFAETLEASGAFKVEDVCSIRSRKS